MKCFRSIVNRRNPLICQEQRRLQKHGNGNIQDYFQDYNGSQQCHIM
jgi:hypothetical protein